MTTATNELLAKDLREKVVPIVKAQLEAQALSSERLANMLDKPDEYVLTPIQVRVYIVEARKRIQMADEIMGGND